MIRVNLGNINDIAVKEALESLIEQLNTTEILKGEWDFLEFTFPAGGTFRIPHTLGFVPQDVIEVARASTLTSVIYNFQQHDKNLVNITVTGSGKLRFLIGKHNVKRG